MAANKKRGAAIWSWAEKIRYPTIGPESNRAKESAFGRVKIRLASSKETASLWTRVGWYWMKYLSTVRRSEAGTELEGQVEVSSEGVNGTGFGVEEFGSVNECCWMALLDTAALEKWVLGSINKGPGNNER